MRYGLFLLLSLFMWQACDVEDKGNYDYDYQNGGTITFADEEMNQTLEKGVDTLKIHPWRVISTVITRIIMNISGFSVPGRNTNTRRWGQPRI